MFRPHIWVGCTKPQHETESFSHLLVFNPIKTCIINIYTLFIYYFSWYLQSVNHIMWFSRTFSAFRLFLQNTTIIIGYYNRSTHSFGKCQVKYKTSKYHKAEIWNFDINIKFSVRKYERFETLYNGPSTA